MNRFIWILFVFALFMVASFFLLRAFFRLVYLAGPILLVIALILDYRAFFRYIDRVVLLIRQNFILGILAGIASVIFYPFVALFLLGQFLNRKNRSGKDEWTPYEDITDSKKS
jgi:hypothetical protein